MAIPEIYSLYSKYNQFNQASLEILVKTMEENFDMTKADFACDDCSFLHSHQFPDIDKIETNIVALRAEIEKLRDKIAQAAQVQKESINVDNKNGSLVFRGSTKTMKAIQAIAEYKAHVHLLKSGGTLELPQLQLLGFRVFEEQGRLKKAIERAVPIACEAFTDATHSIWRDVEEWIECIDIEQCIAKVSVERAFTRPSFASSVATPAEFEFENLRHPLIESTLTRTEYVKHNIKLTPTSRGWLVYGMNASGKSSLMKSVGIATLLAQVGAPVPASKAIIAPFRAIFTRILNQDNLWAGLSSFAVEMSEMREILSYADENTLVLGDELCSGTESASAHALVAAGIDWLSQKRSKYIFATHLHGLLSVLPPPETLSLSVYHLRVKYDAVRDVLVYERTLTPGPGNSLYGLEVARAMHVPQEYYEKALKYRQKFLGEKAADEINKSSWNPHLLRTGCELCGASTTGLEVHHIRQRKDATGTHFADGTARDDARNLVVVCDKCHDHHHAGAIQIEPIQMTSAGPMRPATTSAPQEYINDTPPRPRQRKSQWSPEQQAIIDDFLMKYKTSPLKRIAILLKEEGIEIGEASLRSARNAIIQ